MERTLTVKRLATIPKAIREHLRLKPGDRVEFFVHTDGTVVLLPKLAALALRGAVKSRRWQAATVAEMTRSTAVKGAASAPRSKRR